MLRGRCGFRRSMPRHWRVTPRSSINSRWKGWCCFALLWWFARKPRAVAPVSALFLIGYGAGRSLPNSADNRIFSWLSRIWPFDGPVVETCRWLRRSHVHGLFLKPRRSKITRLPHVSPLTPVNVRWCNAAYCDGSRAARGAAQRRLGIDSNPMKFCINGRGCHWRFVGAKLAAAGEDHLHRRWKNLDAIRTRGMTVRFKR